MLDVVRFLSSPAAYPEHPEQVEIIETHLSWIFLTHRFAYKLKKPVQVRSADLRKRRARLRNCREEVRLNRRLAPEIYLGVVPVTATRGSLCLGAPGLAVDWVVKMRRLPRERMLDRLIAAREWHALDIEPVARLLCEFYLRGPAESIRPGEFRQRFVHDCDESERLLTQAPCRLGREQVIAVTGTLRQFVRDHGVEFDRRVREQRIVEGHGDLRPEHVCLSSPPVVFDCLEFERRLRIVDPVEELSFLALECERLGAAELGNQLLATYSREANDSPPSELVCFYKACSALVRAKLAAWHLEEPGRRGREHWLDLVANYFGLARRYASVLNGRLADQRWNHQHAGA